MSGALVLPGMRPIAAIAIAILLGAGVTADLFACSIGVILHELDPREVEIDRVAPQKPVLEVSNVTRGRGAEVHGDGTMSVSSCDDIGWIELRFVESPRDDRSSRADLGFIVKVVEGSLPLMPAGDGDGHGYRGGGATGEVLALSWIDGATDEQEPIDLTLTVSVVDLGGNRSEPSERIRIQHSGRSAD